MSVDVQSAAVTLEPDAQAFADAVAAPPFLTEMGPQKGREALDQVQTEASAERPDVTVEDFKIAGGPTGEVNVRLLRPVNLSGTLPVILFTHGAGWVFGDPTTHDRLARELAFGANAAVLLPHYVRSPEAKYPQANEESFAASRWIVSDGAGKSLDPERIVVFGDSCRREHGRRPVADGEGAWRSEVPRDRAGLPGHRRGIRHRVLRAVRRGISPSQRHDGMVLDQYTEDPAERSLITVSPLKASIDDLRGLPPTLVITGEAEVLRDEGEAYARKLRAAGVDVEASRYGGAIHDFMMLDATRNTRGAKAATAETVAFIRRHLGT